MLTFPWPCRDLASYQECFANFGIPLLNDRFAMLRQLGNLFVVQPEVLKTFMSESYLGQIEPQLLRPYLAQRVDFTTFARRFAEDEGFGVDVDAPVPSSASAFSVDRLSMLGGQAYSIGKGRLTGMMDELQAFSAGRVGESDSARMEGRISANREARTPTGSMGPAGRGPGSSYFVPMPM